MPGYEGISDGTRWVHNSGYKDELDSGYGGISSSINFWYQGHYINWYGG